MEITEKLNLWCIVELMGHQKIAGKCTEQSIAGVNMLRVDVPATETTSEFTKFYGGSAIYSINPVDEVSVIAMVNQLKVTPVAVWNIQSYLDKQPKGLLPVNEYIKGDAEHNDDDDLPW